MSHYHAVVWIDHHEARVFEFNADDVEGTVVRPDNPAKHLHSKAGSVAGARAQEDPQYFDAVADAVSEAGEIIVCGPANAKTELIKHWKANKPDLSDKVVAVENADHPSDGELVKFAREAFGRIDRMRPQMD